MGKYKEKNEGKIYESSKALFYEHGYTSTTCLKIAKESLVVGLITIIMVQKVDWGLKFIMKSCRQLKAKVKENLEKLGIEATLLLQTAIEWRVLKQ